MDQSGSSEGGIKERDPELALRAPNQGENPCLIEPSSLLQAQPCLPHVILCAPEASVRSTAAHSALPPTQLFSAQGNISQTDPNPYRSGTQLSCSECAAGGEPPDPFTGPVPAAHCRASPGAGALGVSLG